MPRINLIGVRVQNLRGYRDTKLSLKSDRIVIVGPNNSGKTSILRLIDWTINHLDLEDLKENRKASQDELEFLLPARETRHRARRLTLEIKINDKRSQRRFSCDSSGITSLRLNIRLANRCIYAAIGRPKSGEIPESTPIAIELLERLRKNIRFVHIPAFRDAESWRFKTTLSNALRERISERALHETQGGAPQEYRQLTRAKAEIDTVLRMLAQPLWNEVQRRLMPGMARGAEVRLNYGYDDLLDFFGERLDFGVSTGEHDSSFVAMNELGSGLQSLLDLAIHESSLTREVPIILAVEEPEAFLHPSAQRGVARYLFSNRSDAYKTIVTTHSPIIVEEAKFGDIVLSSKQRFFEPQYLESERRSSINTSLMFGYGAEMLFARSVLFVEGEGDRQFFEQIRRRLAQIDPSGVTDSCFVVPVGGKTGFAPWIKLLESYRQSGHRPMKWLVVTDGDASTEVRTAFRHAGVTIRRDILDVLGGVTAAFNIQDFEEARNKITYFNRLSSDAVLPIHMLALDLEEAILKNASHETIGAIMNEIGVEEVETKDELLYHLGSRGSGATNGNKSPWIRGLIGATIPFSELAPDLKECIHTWISGAAEENEFNSAIWESVG